LTNKQGQIISAGASAGKMGFKGSKRMLIMLLRWLQMLRK
jgi:hypothetical protein